MTHGTDLDYPGGLKQLAEDLGDLRYDALAAFLELLADKLARDGAADLGRGRRQLAGQLHEAAHYVRQAWLIAKPHL